MAVKIRHPIPRPKLKWSPWLRGPPFDYGRSLMMDSGMILVIRLKQISFILFVLLFSLTCIIRICILGTFNMHVSVESLFFIGSQLVALSRPPVGKIGVWHSMTQHWQIQDVTPVSSYDTAGSLLLLGCSNGSICYIGKTAPLSP